MEMKFCQSCGMPLTSDEVCGTNADGSLSADYCTYCYQQGKFAQDCTMDEMIEHCAQFVEEFNKDSEQKVTKEEAIAMMKQGVSEVETLASINNVPHRTGKTNRGTNDPPLLPEERGERNFVPAMQGSVGICTCTVVTLSIRRKERYLSTLYHTLLQTGDAGTDERNHEMGRAKNVVVSSGSGYPTFMAGIYQKAIKNTPQITWIFTDLIMKLQ